MTVGGDGSGRIGTYLRRGRVCQGIVVNRRANRRHRRREAVRRAVQGQLAPAPGDPGQPPAARLGTGHAGLVGSLVVSRGTSSLGSTTSLGNPTRWLVFCGWFVGDWLSWQTPGALSPDLEDLL